MSQSCTISRCRALAEPYRGVARVFLVISIAQFRFTSGRRTRPLRRVQQRAHITNFVPVRMSRTYHISIDSHGGVLGLPPPLLGASLSLQSPSPLPTSPAALRRRTSVYACLHPRPDCTPIDYIRTSEPEPRQIWHLFPPLLEVSCPPSRHFSDPVASQGGYASLAS